MTVFAGLHCYLWLLLKKFNIITVYKYSVWYNFLVVNRGGGGAVGLLKLQRHYI